MAARLIQILVALTFIIAGAAVGQTLFGTSTTQPKPTSTSGTMSPSDFQKAVNSLGQQSQQQLMQQFKSQFNSGPGGNTMPAPQLPTLPTTTPTTTPTKPTTATPSQQPGNKPPIVQPATPSAPTAAPATPPQAAQPPIDNSQQLAPAQGSSVYTGFAPPAKENNSNDSNSSNGNTPSSGGWNIQY